jgi:hypothetical protein
MMWKGGMVVGSNASGRGRGRKVGTRKVLLSNFFCCLYVFCFSSRSRGSGGLFFFRISHHHKVLRGGESVG